MGDLELSGVILPGSDQLSSDGWITIAVLVGLVILFATEKIRPDIVAVIGLVAMAFTGVVDTGTALSGFSHPAVVTVVAFYVISAAITDAGVPQAIASLLSRVAGGSQVLLTALLMGMVGGMSAFINNIAATLILMPATTRLARGIKISALKLLMPLSFGSLLGGLATLIGTPPNIIAADLLAEGAGVQLRMFDYAPTGLAVMAVGMVYFAVVGNRLLPSRPAQGEMTRVEQLREFLFELRITGQFQDPGRSLLRLGWRGRFGLSVLEIRRAGRRQRTISASDQIFIGDTVVVSGEYDDVMKLASEPGVDFERRANSEHDLAEGTVMAELVATPWFDQHPRTLTEFGFGSRYRGVVLGIWRHGQRVRSNLARALIRGGDVLMAQIPRAGLVQLANDHHFLVLGQRTDHLERLTPSALRALAILVAVVAAATLGLVHIAVAVLAGILAMLALRVISPRRIYDVVDWRLPILVGAMIPIGSAMQDTGVAAYLASLIADGVADYGPYAVVAAVFFTTALLTQATANATAVVIMAPIALSLAAGGLGVSPAALMITVAIAASTAFLTPFGHQANLLVYNAGGYRYLEFTRVGGPLTLLVMVVTVLMVQLVWPA